LEDAADGSVLATIGRPREASRRVTPLKHLTPEQRATTTWSTAPPGRPVAGDQGRLREAVSDVRPADTADRPARRLRRPAARRATRPPGAADRGRLRAARDGRRRRVERARCSRPSPEESDRTPTPADAGRTGAGRGVHHQTGGAAAGAAGERLRHRQPEGVLVVLYAWWRMPARRDVWKRRRCRDRADT